MATKNLAVFGIFTDQLTAEDGIDGLKEAGFRSTDISVLFPDNQGARQFGHERHSKAPEGAVAGGSTGAIIGGALGWLAGLGALAIPGVGPFIAAGPLMGMLGGIGVGTTVGGITGALLGLGIPEYEAKRYEGRIRNGCILLSVHCDDRAWAERATSTLHASGAEDVACSTEAKADFHVADRPEARHAH